MQKYSVSYERALNRIVDTLYQEAYARGWTWEKMAERSGLSLQTVIKLGEYTTRLPQFRTVEMIAQSLGGSLVFREGKLSHYKRKHRKWGVSLMGKKAVKLRLVS